MFFLPNGDGQTSVQVDSDGFPTGEVIASNILPELAPIALSDTEIKWIEHCIGAKPEEGILSSEISAVEIDGERVVTIELPKFIDFKRRNELEVSLQQVFHDQKTKGESSDFHSGEYQFHLLATDTENKEQFERERRRIEDYVVVELDKLLHAAGVVPLKIRIRPTRLAGKIQRLVGAKWNLILDVLTKKPDAKNAGDVKQGQAIASNFIGELNSPAIDRIVDIHIHEVNPHFAAFEEEEAARRRQNVHSKLAKKRKTS